MWTLRITIGGRMDAVHELPVGKDLVLGRDPTADVVLGERSVSRRHCRVTGTPLGVDVADLNSANGVWVGGRQIETARLKSGGEMLIGNVSVVVGRRDGPTGMVP